MKRSFKPLPRVVEASFPESATLVMPHIAWSHIIDRFYGGKKKPKERQTKKDPTP
jgi:hypothetical protein